MSSKTAFNAEDFWKRHWLDHPVGRTTVELRLACKWASRTIQELEKKLKDQD